MATAAVIECTFERGAWRFVRIGPTGVILHDAELDGDNQSRNWGDDTIRSFAVSETYGEPSDNVKIYRD